MRAGSMASVVLAVASVSGIQAIAGAQDPLRTLPKNYWVEFENAWLKVIHVRYLPHEMVPLHDHPGPPTLFVYLSDAGQVRFLHGDSDVVDGLRPPVKVGQMRVTPGKTETHRVENVSDQQSDFLRVEFTSLPVGLENFDKRIAAADEAFWSKPELRVIEFEGPHLRVTRVGVLPGKSVQLKEVSGTETAWLAVRAEGASVAGKPVHAGEAWAGSDLALRARSARVELVQLEVR